MSPTFRKLRHSFYIGLHTQLFKKLKVLRSGNLDLTSNSLNCSIWDKRADYFLHWFSPFTYRMFNWLSLANTLSGNDCNLLNDKSLWKDEKNEVIVKKIDAKILKEAVFNPLHPDIILFSRHFLRCWQG